MVLHTQSPLGMAVLVGLEAVVVPLQPMVPIQHLQLLLLWAAVACGLVVIAVNSDFYRLCLRKRGIGFAVSSISLHWLYFVYSSLTFAAVTLHELWRRGRRTPASDVRGLQPTAATAAMMLSAEVSQFPPLGQ